MYECVCVCIGFSHTIRQCNKKYPQTTYDSLLHLIYPCSLRLHRTSSSSLRTPRSHTGTRPPDIEVSWVLFSGCSAPWTHQTCPCSLGHHHNSTRRGCTLSHCSEIRVGHRLELNTSLHRWRPHSHRRHHRQRSVPHTSHYGTGSHWRGTPCHL